MTLPLRPPAMLTAAMRPLAVLAVVLLADALGAPPAQAQATLALPDAEATRAAVRMVRRLSPERRIGQLFLVPFHGAEVSDGSAIARLIDDYGIGGVVLSPARENYRDGPDAPVQVARVANALQSRAARSGAFVPLFVTVEQVGGIYPADSLSGGMTPLPSAMALGATWRADLAEQVGMIVGRELSACGINLLQGPQLDVTRVVRPGTSGDLGERVFGGSPAWVAQLGRSYIAGIHRGSGGRVFTVAGSLPGIGAADRSQTEEAPVVESTLEQLLAADLVPFVATAGARDQDERTDGLATSLVRYRAVQQQPDRPLALDSGGLRYLWAQVPSLAAWREAGGLLVSPPLGVPAVRRYVDSVEGEFNARRALRETLVAGHDILTMTHVGADDDPEAQAEAISSALEWLATTYREDEAIRELVDAAVVRVLAAKWRLFGDSSLSDVLVDAEAAASQTGLGIETVAQVSRAALTLVTPAGGTAVAAGPRSPKPGEQVLFIVDHRPSEGCADCPAASWLDPEALVAAVRRTYGAEGIGRLRHEEDVRAITFLDLKAWLQAKGHVGAADTTWLVPSASPAHLAEVESSLRRADWLVFAMRDVRPSEAMASDALKLFLRALPSELADRRLVAIAFAAPYYLDTTEIAKLTAYYAVYAPAEPFVTVAVRAIFGDEPAQGASPVSIPGVVYDLDQQLQPALSQVLRLELVGADASAPIRLGSTLRVRTSPIVDGNGHLVPDGTAVAFRLYDRQEGVYLPDVRSTTREGRALAALRAERHGEVEIQVVLDNGLRSEPLVLSIAGGRSPVAQTTPAPGAPGMAWPLRPQVAVDWGILVLSLGLMLIAGVLVFAFDAEASQLPARSLRLFLLSLAWGLAGYLLVAAGGLGVTALPGGASLWPARLNPAYQAPLISLVLALLPIVPAVAHARRAAVRVADDHGSPAKGKRPPS